MARLSNWTAHTERPDTDYPDYMRHATGGYDSIEDLYIAMDTPAVEDKYLEIDE